MKRAWTDKELRFLRDYYGFFALRHMAEILSVSEGVLKQKISDLGFSKRELKLHDTLCWFCKKAGGLCSWSRDFTPIKDWNAIPTFIANDNQSSFIVMQCPQFEVSENILR